jgi:hypothetical protein
VRASSQGHLHDLLRAADPVWPFGEQLVGDIGPGIARPIDGAQKLIERFGVAAELPFPNAAGYALASRGIDTRTLQPFMGHYREHRRLHGRSPTNASAISEGNERAGRFSAPRRSGFRLRHIGDSEFARDRDCWLDDRAIQTERGSKRLAKAPNDRTFDDQIGTRSWVEEDKAALRNRIDS